MPANKKHDAWPSVEEQLAAHKIVRGSALEQLVRDNQDFHMLRPEEAHDDLKIPPWLRVYSRKRFPGFRHLAEDPTGGYPGWLNGLLRLMLHQPEDPAWKRTREGGQP